MKLGEGVHLTYCTNIHPGETLDEVRSILARHVVAVRDRVAPGRAFGVGLRLSARAAAELAAPAALAALRDQLHRDGLYVFTLNGFPYGAFQGTRVKAEVYLPDWRDPERLRYTNQLADLLAALLPDDPSLQGSISTVPGAFKAAQTGPARDEAGIAEHLLRHVAHLVALRRRSGRRIALALEPEPLCLLETVDETVAFFAAHLHSAPAARRLAELTGLDETAAADALRAHLGVCLDLCHAAVEFEDASVCLDRLQAAGIAVVKLQVSVGLVLPEADDTRLAALRRFDDGVYLHQVVQRQGGTLTRFADLADAFAARRAGPAEPAEWRVHFHVPIFLEQLPPFASTQAFVREVLARQRVTPVSRHLEVETYTWDVLPAPYRNSDGDGDGAVDAAVARELAWVGAQLGVSTCPAATEAAA